MWCYIYSPLHGMVRQVGTWWAVHHLSLSHTHTQAKTHMGHTGDIHTPSCNNSLSSHLCSACSICAEEICLPLKRCVFVCECVWSLSEALHTINPVDHSHLLGSWVLFLFYFPSVLLHFIFINVVI